MTNALRGILSIGLSLLAGVWLIACTDGTELARNPVTVINNTPATQQQRVQGEYIISLRKGGDEKHLRALYKKYGIQKVTPMGRGRYLIRIQRDPGLERLKKETIDSEFIKAVQPNFRYHTTPISLFTR